MAREDTGNAGRRKGKRGIVWRPDNDRIGLFAQ
jgi:hypothetical protein